MRKAVVIVSLLGFALAEEPPTTKCQTGAADLLGKQKTFAVQVCNLFGATCYMNHPAAVAENCATEALMIKTGECKLYPIREFKDNKVRSGDSAQEEMSTPSDVGCSISSSCSNNVCTYSYKGSCVSMQCSLGGDPATFAGPAYSGTKNKRTPVTDTTTETFTPTTVAGIPAASKQLKNVFIVRTGNHIATTYVTAGSSNSISWSVGRLPTSDGNNYGPKKCPSTNMLMTNAKVNDITAEELRMCGSTGKWVYYNAMNFVLDKNMYAQYSADEGKTTKININSVPYLLGKSAYRSGKAMDDSRSVFLLDGSKSSSDVFMSSSAISPKPGSVAPFKDEVGGTWRSFGVAFYCDDYARTDLTACKAENRKMLYVCDPNPNACYGVSAVAVGSNAKIFGDICTADAECCSGSCIGTDSLKTCAPGCEDPAAGGSGGGSSGTGGSGGTTGSVTYQLVGNAACVDDAGSHGAGALAFKKTTTKADPHTNCQAACTADSTCTGYDTRATGCLYYKITIAKSNNAATTYQCYKKVTGSSGTGSSGGTTSSSGSGSSGGSSGGTGKGPIVNGKELTCEDETYLKPVLKGFETTFQNYKSCDETTQKYKLETQGYETELQAGKNGNSNKYGLGMMCVGGNMYYIYTADTDQATWDALKASPPDESKVVLKCLLKEGSAGGSGGGSNPTDASDAAPKSIAALAIMTLMAAFQ